jgi:glycosyltransferase involved in cell wall biosynthesis
LLIPPKDPQAIAEAVLRLIRDREAALALAERGRSRICLDFNAELNHRRVLELFQKSIQLS